MSKDDVDKKIQTILGKLNQKSSAHKFLRRMYYGFPNKVFLEDTDEFCEIDDDTDPKSAVYLPNTRQTDSRSFDGLNSFNKRKDLLKLVRGILQ